MNVGKSKVIRCSRYGNKGRMHVRLNDEPCDEVNCFKYMGSQMAADGCYEMDVVHRMNLEYRALGVLKSVMNYRVFLINGKKCVYEGVIVRAALYGAEVWCTKSAERRKVFENLG